MVAQEGICNILQRFPPKPLDRSREGGKEGRRLMDTIIKKGHSNKW